MHMKDFDWISPRHPIRKEKKTFAIIDTRQEIDFLPYVGFLIYDSKKDPDISKIQEYVGQVFSTDPV